MKLHPRQKIALANPIGRANQFDLIARLGATQRTAVGYLRSVLTVNR